MQKEDKVGDVVVKNRKKSWLESNLVIYPDRRFYRSWQILVLLVCTITAVLWPYLIAMHRNESGHTLIVFVNSCEVIMLFDMIFKFLLAYKLEGETTYIDDIRKTSKRYLYSEFILDFIIWQPLIYILSFEWESLWFFMIIKTSRFSRLFDLIDQKNIVPLIRNYYDNLNK